MSEVRKITPCWIVYYSYLRPYESLHDLPSAEYKWFEHRKPLLIDYANFLLQRNQFGAFLTLLDTYREISDVAAIQLLRTQALLKTNHTEGNKAYADDVKARLYSVNLDAKLFDAVSGVSHPLAQNDLITRVKAHLKAVGL